VVLLNQTELGSASTDADLSLINLDNAADYLLARGLLDTKSIVDGDLKIIDSSRRNRNLQVIRKKDTSFMIKQPSPTDPVNTVTIKKEALLYLLMQTNKDFMSLKDIAPSILDFDDTKNVVITEFVREAQSWNSYYYQSAEPTLKKEEFARLGRIVASYHEAFSGMAASPNLGFLQGGFVPVAAIVRPGPEIFVELTSSNLKLLKTIQQYPTFYDSLEELYAGWRSETLIHGDLKWDNIISSPDGADKKIKIVDWESASMGDPAWDVGSIFHEFIRYWLSFMPISGRESAEQLVERASLNLKDIHPVSRAFWNSYITQRQIQGKAANELLVRSARFCAARLVQTAYESLYSTTELPNIIVYMIQVSANIFNRTNDALVQLLGIPFQGEWSL
jgi:hypothetical protein